jgi:hypothetical protein
MSELFKTAIFGVVALVSVTLAIAFQGRVASVAVPEEVGQSMFPAFDEHPLDAKSLSIVRFDEALADLKEIEVKEVNGVWTLPTHQGYPADAQDKIRDATTQFANLKIIRVQSDATADHSMYGVLEPNRDKSSAGDVGVGTRVAIRNAKGEALVDLIIGKEVKGQEGQRYVRRTGKSRVYIAKVNPDNLPVKFEDWIEKDLLKVNSWDVDELVLKDYSFDVEPTFSGPRTSYDQRLQITLKEESSKWKLVSMLENQNDQLVESKLLETEELNEERIDGLRTALDDLKIVNVEPKPQGLTEDLKADEGFFKNEQGFNSLIERGFYPVQTDDNTVELLSTDGEVLARTKDGVEYVLRFGKVQGIDTEGGAGKLNRYLLVSAQLNEAKFPQPELEALPDLPQDASAQNASPAASEKSDGPDSDTAEQDSAKAADASSESKPAENPPEQPSTTNGPAGETKDGQESADSETDKPADASKTKSDQEPDDSKASSTDKKIDISAERERITKENQRKIDERNDKIKKARQKVNELNYRFADWYYVISEDVYKKIHLSRSDMIKETEKAKKEGTGLDAFEELKKGPEKKDATDTDTSSPVELDGADSIQP